mgnify:FL=1
MRALWKSETTASSQSTGKKWKGKYVIPDGKKYYEGFFHERVYHNSQLLLGYFSEEVILYTEGIVNRVLLFFPHFIQCINKLYAKQKKKLA